MGRRDSKDEQWAALKERVRRRDGNKDRIFRVVSVQEAMLIRKGAGRMLQKLDCAHIFPVGLYPELCYVDENVVLLNRYSHSLLDDMRDPIKGGSISKIEVYEWWEKIAGKKQWSRLMEAMGQGVENDGTNKLEQAV
jgi:hypothetical protein